MTGAKPRKRRGQRVAHRAGGSAAAMQQEHERRPAGARRRVRARRTRARPAARPAAPRRRAGGAARAARRAVDASVASTPTVTRSCSASSSSARSTATPASAPGSDQATTARTSRHSGAGRRRSPSSVSRLTSSPSSDQQPDRLLGRGRREQQRRGDEREAEADRGLQRRARPPPRTAAATASRLIACHPRRPWRGTSRPSRSSRSSSTGCATFVREEVWPIETVFDELGQARLRPRDRAAEGARSRSAGCGRRTCRPSSAARASARSSSG